MTSLQGTVKALWGRAPLWRFALMSSLLLTLLFILFPPEGPRTSPSTEAIPPQAKYKSQSVASNKAVITPQASDPLSSSTPVNSVPLNQSAVATSPPQPKTATVSLAMPGKSDPNQNETGLNEAMTGRIFTGSIPVSGFSLPLPEGNWVMLANSSIHYQDNSGMSYFLGRIEHKRLVGAVTVYALKTTPPSFIDVNWPMVKWSGCSRTNTLFMSKEQSDENGLDSCWYIYDFFTPYIQKWADRAVAMNNIDRAAAGDLAAKGVTYPQDFVSVEFSRIANWGFLYAIYMFSTDVEGIKSSEALAYPDSDWTPGNIIRFSEKVAFIEKIKKWGVSFLPRIKEAFNNGHVKNDKVDQRSIISKTASGDNAKGPAAKDEKQYEDMSTVSPQSHYIAVAVTRENIESELKKCVPEIGFNSDMKNDIQNFPFPANTIKAWGHVNSSKKFVLQETKGVCVQKSSHNFTIFAADEFIKTVNPLGLSPDVVEEWYKKIAVLIASKGMAKIAYVFNNGNAHIATYWVESSPDYALFYSSSFKKAGEWETEVLDIKFSNSAMTSVTETKRSGLGKKTFPLAN